jgi:hypothetical protein
MSCNPNDYSDAIDAGFQMQAELHDELEAMTKQQLEAIVKDPIPFTTGRAYPAFRAKEAALIVIEYKRYTPTNA